MLLASAPAIGHAQVYVGVGVNIAPPAIPVYTQPPAPAPNYIWQPGYWAWGPGGYYWVPGTWVAAPAVGMLWTPGYWGWGSSAYYWHPGYWGRTVGFYGGINYGFGYFGAGYVGGGWNGGVFRYNTAITNVNRVVIHNTYIDKTVVYRNDNNHTGYNGGHGGIQAHPTQGQISARGYGIAPTSEQQYHEQLSGQDGIISRPSITVSRTPPRSRIRTIRTTGPHIRRRSRTPTGKRRSNTSRRRTATIRRPTAIIRRRTESRLTKSSKRAGSGALRGVRASTATS